MVQNFNDLDHFAWLLWGEEINMLSDYGKHCLNAYRMFHNNKIDEKELIKRNKGRLVRG